MEWPTPPAATISSDRPRPAKRNTRCCGPATSEGDGIRQEVLKSQAIHEINRVLTIYFPDREAMQQFLSAEPYNAIKVEFFESSVACKA